MPAGRVGVGAQVLAEAGAVEDVVAEDEGDGLVADEVGADEERLGQALGLRLDGVADLDADLGPVAEQPLEAGLVLGGRDDQDLADPGIHQQGERVVDHRLVVDRHQLLADRLGDRIEPRAAATGQDDPSHGRSVGGWSEARGAVPAPRSLGRCPPRRAWPSTPPPCRPIGAVSAGTSTSCCPRWRPRAPTSSSSARTATRRTTPSSCPDADLRAAPAAVARRPVRLAWEQVGLPRLARQRRRRRPALPALHDAAGLAGPRRDDAARRHVLHPPRGAPAGQAAVLPHLDADLPGARPALRHAVGGHPRRAGAGRRAPTRPGSTSPTSASTRRGSTCRRPRSGPPRGPTSASRARTWRSSGRSSRARTCRR